MSKSTIISTIVVVIWNAVSLQGEEAIDKVFVPPISYTNRNFEKSGFSAHHCVGGNDYAAGASERSCVFFNVCHLHGEEDIIHYYVDPFKFRMPIYSEGLGVLYDFTPNLVYRGAYSYPKWATPGTWAPVIDQHTSPKSFSYEESEYSIFFQGFAETNFGEFINLLHTLYVLPLLHGYVPSTNMTLLDGDSPVSKSILAHKFRRQLLHKRMTQHKPVFLRTVGDKCYKTLFVGSGMLSVLHGSMLHAMTVDKLRDYILTNLEFKPPELAINNRHRILILLKSTLIHKVNLSDTENTSSGYHNHENHILNADKLALYLSHELREIADITTMTPDEHSISSQIDEFQNSTVVITAPGGGSFGALFMRKGASLIILDRFYGKHGSQRFISGYNGREDSWWTHMHSINLLHYPVCDQAEQGGDDVHDHIIVLSRMLHVSVLAMQAAENRYDHLENTAALNLLASKQGLMSDLCSIKI